MRRGRRGKSIIMSGDMSTVILSRSVREKGKGRGRGRRRVRMKVAVEGVQGGEVSLEGEETLAGDEDPKPSKPDQIPPNRSPRSNAELVR